MVAGNQSDSSATTALAAGSGSLTSQPSGARSGQFQASYSNPGMLRAAMVLSGPAETRLTRTFLSPT